MTPEQLLIPRRKVITGWFQSNINPFHVGDILIKNGIHFTRVGNPKSIHENEIDLYPHLIKPLAWWEDREEKDMPQFVKAEWENKLLGVYKITRWELSQNRGHLPDNGFIPQVISLHKGVEPATEKQYLEYLTTLKP